MQQNIESVLIEQRRFEPDPAFVAAARLGPNEITRLREYATRGPGGYWAALARTHLSW